MGAETDVFVVMLYLGCPVMMMTMMMSGVISRLVTNLCSTVLRKIIMRVWHQRERINYSIVVKRHTSIIPGIIMAGGGGGGGVESDFRSLLVAISETPLTQNYNTSI